jgi:hypothetical protein
MFKVGQEVKFGNGPVISGEIVECDNSTVTVGYYNAWARRFEFVVLPLDAPDLVVVG